MNFYRKCKELYLTDLSFRISLYSFSISMIFLLLSCLYVMFCLAPYQVEVKLALQLWFVAFNFFVLFLVEFGLLFWFRKREFPIPTFKDVFFTKMITTFVVGFLFVIISGFTYVEFHQQRTTNFILHDLPPFIEGYKIQQEALRVLTEDEVAQKAFIQKYIKNISEVKDLTSDGRIQVIATIGKNSGDYLGVE